MVTRMLNTDFLRENTSINRTYRSLSQEASSELEHPLLRILDGMRKRLKSEREQQYHEVFSVLIRAMQAKDSDLYTHSQRVQRYASRLARTLALPEDEVKTIELAALFHDIGKIGIHDIVLNKPARLTPLEYDYVKEHAMRGALILTHSGVLRHLASLVRTHHEQWNGSGYPFGLQGEAIPTGARIIAIADAFEAMTANRVYQAARTPLQALEEIRRCAGTHFDPVLVERFCGSMGLPPLPTLSEPAQLSVGQ
jgi:putative nucleotidyltransferase with HDIG domain